MPSLPLHLTFHVSRECSLGYAAFLEACGPRIRDLVQATPDSASGEQESSCDSIHYPCNLTAPMERPRMASAGWIKGMALKDEYSSLTMPFVEQLVDEREVQDLTMESDTSEVEEVKVVAAPLRPETAGTKRRWPSEAGWEERETKSSDYFGETTPCRQETTYRKWSSAVGGPMARVRQRRAERERLKKKDRWNSDDESIEERDAFTSPDWQEHKRNINSDGYRVDAAIKRRKEDVIEIDLEEEEEAFEQGVEIECRRMFGGCMEYKGGVKVSFESSKLVMEFRTLDKKRETVWTDYDNMTMFQCVLDDDMPVVVFATSTDRGLAALTPYYQAAGPPEKRFVVIEVQAPDTFASKVLNQFVFRDSRETTRLAQLYNRADVPKHELLRGVDAARRQAALVDKEGGRATAFLYPDEASVDAVRVSVGDRSRLKDGEFLNDALVDCGMLRRLAAEPPAVRSKVHVFSTFFFTKMVDASDSPGTAIAAVARWTKKVDLFDKHLVCVPVNEHLHWSLAVVANLSQMRPCILIFDSLGSHDAQRVADYLLAFLRADYRDKKQCERTPEWLDDIPVVSPALPRQPNSYDCGTYLLKYFDDLLSKQLPLDLPKEPSKATLKPRFAKDIFGHSHVSRLRADLLAFFDQRAAHYAATRGPAACASSQPLRQGTLTTDDVPRRLQAQMRVTEPADPLPDVEHNTGETTDEDEEQLRYCSGLGYYRNPSHVGSP